MKRLMFAAACALAAACAPSARAGDVRTTPHKRYQLWPEGKMPQVATNLDNQAWIEVYLPTNRPHDACMIIAPGGCYVWWCWGGEGSTMLEHCCRNDMPAVQLKYRCPRPKGNTFYLNAWQDAQRAVRFVRAHAKEWGISPDNIGFNGYSAGGHLTLMAALSSTSNSYARVDEIDDLPCNVNWAIPVYPAYVLSDTQNDWGGGSEKGNPLTLEIRPEFLFDKGTPPMCLFHGDADDISPMGSVRVYHKLRLMGIPGELHTFANRGHVFFSDASAGESCVAFRDTAFGWLNSMGFTLERPRVMATEKWQENFRKGVRGFALKIGKDTKVKDLVGCFKLRPEIRLEFELESPELEAEVRKVLKQCKVNAKDIAFVTAGTASPVANTVEEYRALKAKGVAAVRASDPVALRAAIGAGK